METANPASTTDRPVMNVLEAIASRFETEPSDLDTPLYTAVDPDALGRLIDSKSDVTITFDYDGHTVAISGDGSVTIDERPRGEVDTR